jgi:uncharacterized protein
MEIQELTLQECRAMLGGTDVARLACARNNQPYIVPVRVYLEGDFLYGYTTLGQKIEWMRENPLVCLEMDEFLTYGHWASVVIFGRYEELPDTFDYRGLRIMAEQLFQRHPMWWEPASVPVDGGHQRTRIVFRIHMHQVTGRRAVPDTVNRSLGRQPSARRPPWLARVLRRR